MHTPANSSTSSRRRFLQNVALGGLAAWAGPQILPPLLAQPQGAPAGSPQGRKLGIALVGLGNYSRGELGPALKTQTKYCRLAGVVTGSREKGLHWSREYGFPETSVYDYSEMNRLAENREIDIVYVVTPVGLHRDHTIAAAAAGKHVICEKPMARSVAECDEMIGACQRAGVKLSIGYRLQFEPHHQELDRLAQDEVYGPLTRSEGEFGFTARRRSWRMQKELSGGGPLMDVGIYIIQAACRAARGAPIAVTAAEAPKTEPELFAEVEEAIKFTLEFRDGKVCEGFTSYSQSGNRFMAQGDRGAITLQPAYSYRGISGQSHQGPLNLENVPQQALQMDNFAHCIGQNLPSPVAGEMGRAHMGIIEAIYEAARSQRRTPVRNAEWLDAYYRTAL